MSQELCPCNICFLLFDSNNTLINAFYSSINVKRFINYSIILLSIFLAIGIIIPANAQSDDINISDSVEIKVNDDTIEEEQDDVKDEESQEQTSPIIVTTDKTKYLSGETIMITGNTEEVFGFPVSIQIFDANDNLVTIRQIQVSEDGTFSLEITTGGTINSSGTYTIKVQYGTEKMRNETMFEFVGDVVQKTFAFSAEDIEFSIDYSITAGELLNIIPERATTSLTIMVQATQNGDLIVSLPRELIDAKIQSEEDNDDVFIVIVNRMEINYFEEIETTSSHRTLKIPLSQADQEILIIGTKIIPEFGVLVVSTLVLAVASVILITRRSQFAIFRNY